MLINQNHPYSTKQKSCPKVDFETASSSFTQILNIYYFFQT